MIYSSLYIFVELFLSFRHYINDAISLYILYIFLEVNRNISKVFSSLFLEKEWRSTLLTVYLFWIFRREFKLDSIEKKINNSCMRSKLIHEIWIPLSLITLAWFQCIFLKWSIYLINKIYSPNSQSDFVNFYWVQFYLVIRCLCADITFY